MTFCRGLAVAVRTQEGLAAAPGIEASRIVPVIDKVLPFDQAREALAYLEQGRARGKVVVPPVRT